MNIQSLKPASLLLDQEKKDKISSYRVGIGFIEADTNEIKDKFDNIKPLIAKINEVSKTTGTIIQIFKFEKILSVKHLYNAVYYATMAEINEINISKNPAVEFLLYASQQRQINVAFETLGVDFNNVKDKIRFAYVIRGKIEDNMIKALEQLKDLLNGKDSDEINASINENKIEMIKKTYQISDFEIKNALKSNGITNFESLKDLKNEEIRDALDICIIENMVNLSINH